MAKIKLKNLILTFCLMVAIVCGFAFNTAFAYADAEQITANNMVISFDTTGEGEGQKTITNIFDFVIPESETTSTIEVVLLDNEGVDELSKQTSTDPNYLYQTTIVNPLDSQQTIIRWNNVGFSITNDINYIGSIGLMYQANITRTDTTTYSTNAAEMAITCDATIFTLKEESTNVYVGHVLSDEYYRNNINMSASFGNAQDVVIDTSEVNYDVIGYYNVKYSYTKQVMGRPRVYVRYLLVNVIKDVTDFTLTYQYNGQNVTGSTGSPYNFGEFEPTAFVEFNILSNDAEIVLNNNVIFDKEGFSFTQTITDSLNTVIKITAPTDFKQTVVGTLTSTCREHDIGEIKFVFSISYNITTKPTIVFIEGDLVTIAKKSTLADIEDIMRDQVEAIVEYNGNNVDIDEILDSTKLVITTDIVDVANSGLYTATYTYTSSISGLVATATLQFKLINQGPQLSQVVVSVGEDPISNNVTLDPGTVVGFEITAEDADLDTLTYIVESTIGNTVQDSTYLNKFTFTPNAKLVGSVTFTIYCVDEESESSNQQTFTVRYVDTAKPSITFTDDVKEVSGSYQLHVNKNETIWFAQFVESVQDNIDTLDMSQVTMTTTGFNLDQQNRAIFTITGNYTITYKITDSSENYVQYLVNVLVNNSDPVATAVDGGIHTYNKEIVIELSEYVQDADNDTLKYYRDGVVFDQNDNPVVVQHYEIDQLTGRLTIRPRADFVGTLKLQYHVEDIESERSLIEDITIKIVDNISPIVTRSSLRSDFVINKNQGYSKTGFFTAYDEIDKDNVSVTVKITDLSTNLEIDDIDFSKVGNYRFDYTFKDQSPNSTPATATLTVKVTKGTNPVIILTTDSATLSQGTRFSIFDYIFKITDVEDGDKTTNFKDLYDNGSLKISKTPTTEEIGTYVVSMYYIDSDGNFSDVVTFTLTVEKPSSISPLYFIAGGVVLVSAIGIALIVMAIRKSKMRI